MSVTSIFFLTRHNKSADNFSNFISNYLTRDFRIFVNCFRINFLIIRSSRYDCIMIGSWCREAANAGGRITSIDTSVVAALTLNYDEFHEDTSNYPPRKLLSSVITSIVTVCADEADSNSTESLDTSHATKHVYL